MALGVIIMILPFLGFPSSWNVFFIVVAGLVIVITAYRLKPEGTGSGASANAAPSNAPYAEHKAPVAPSASAAPITSDTPPSAQ
jgi:hypothetical protein